METCRLPIPALGIDIVIPMSIMDNHIGEQNVQAYLPTSQAVQEIPTIDEERSTAWLLEFVHVASHSHLGHICFRAIIA